MSSELFYQNLPAHAGELKDLLVDQRVFVLPPGDWYVLVTDIQGSTQAVTAGRFREVNTIAASGLIVALNIAKRHARQIPFLYGGDGVTMLIPGSLLPEIRAALETLQANTQKAYGLHLRVGSLSVQEIYDHQKTLQIAKWAVAPGYDQALFLGEGLLYADKRIKAEMPVSERSAQTSEVDLQGLVCRWKDVKPSASSKEIVCLIVQAHRSEEQAKLYAQVLQDLDAIYGKPAIRHPITKNKLVVDVALGMARMRQVLRYGNASALGAIRECLRATGSGFLFFFHIKSPWFDPDLYIRQQIAATNTLHVGGMIHTVISGNRTQREVLIKVLDGYEQEGEILYGLAVCPSSVMTCYVPRLDHGHIHFLDGTGGGYTQAAIRFKAKKKKV